MGKQKIKQKTFFVFKKIATIVATVITIVATSNYQIATIVATTTTIVNSKKFHRETLKLSNQIFNFITL